MNQTKQINGIALGAIGVGSIFVYAGIKGYSIPQTIQSVVQGKSPTNQTQAAPISGTASTTSTSMSTSTSPGKGGTPSQNEALGQKLAASYGWDSGAEWSAIKSIVAAESGWNDTIVNPSSGAAGIAQKISGWSSDYQKGNAAQQINWMYAYIKGRYGDPVAAWAFHQANGWY